MGFSFFSWFVLQTLTVTLILWVLSGKCSVVDPWRFCTDPDLRIRTPDYGSGSGPALFISDLFKSSKMKSHKEFTEEQKLRFFILFLLDDGRIRITSKNLRILRIRIQDTG